MDYRIEKQPEFEVLLKVEADRLTYWSEPDLNENQKIMISASKTYAGSNGGLYKKMSNDPADLDGFGFTHFLR